MYKSYIVYILDYRYINNISNTMEKNGTIEKSKSDKRKEMLLRDQEAEEYDEKIVPKYHHRLELCTYFKSLKPKRDDVILDAGCGTGRFTQEILKEGAKVIAIDYSMKSLLICKEKCQNMGKEQDVDYFIIRADICDLPLRPDSVNKIISAGVFEHLPSKKDREEALKGMKRVCKSKGKILLSTYNYDFINRIFKNREGHHAGMIYYYNQGYGEFKRTLSEIFGKVQVRGILNFIRPFWSIERRAGKAYDSLDKLKIISLIERIDGIIEKTPLSRITGYYLFAIIER